MTTEEDLSRLEAALEQPNPRLHLYTLAQHQRVRAAQPSTMDDFREMQRQIESAKTGG